MTVATLRGFTCKDLAKMAKQEGVAGWHSMRKEELVAALAKAARRSQSRASGKAVAPKGRGAGSGRPSSSASRNGKSPAAKKPTAARRKAMAKIDELKTRLALQKNLAAPSAKPSVNGAAANGNSPIVKKPASDRLVLMVRDAYWLQAHWDIQASSVERARTALGQSWHGASPMLRLLRVAEDGSSSVVRDIPIHGGVNHWYIDVAESPKSYRAEIGYVGGNGSNGAFYSIARSNSVTTPTPGSVDAMNGSWSDMAANADRIYAMSGGYSDRGASLELQQLLEDRLQRRLGRPTETRFGHGCAGDHRDDLRFAIDAEIVIFGAAQSHAHVTVDGEPVTLQSDGTFAVRMHLPDRRQVIPVVASTADGTEQKTIILGVERNTKELETVMGDQLNQ